MNFRLKYKILFITVFLIFISTIVKAQISWDTIYNKSSTEYYLMLRAPMPCENLLWQEISNDYLDALVDELWDEVVRNERLNTSKQLNAIRSISLIPTLKAQSLLLENIRLLIPTSSGVSDDVVDYPCFYYILEYGIQHDIFDKALLLALSREQDDMNLSYLSYVFANTLLSASDRSKIMKESDSIFFKNLRKIMESY